MLARVIIILCMTVFVSSCESAGDKSLEQEAADASVILRVIFVEKKGKLKAKNVEVFKNKKALKLVPKYPVVPKMKTVKKGDEWMVFYNNPDFSSKGKEYVSSMRKIKSGEIVSDKRMTVKAFRKLCEGN